MKKILFFLLFPIYCFGQILNVESKNLFDKGDSLKNWKLSSELGFQYLENQKSFLNLNQSNHLQFRKKKHDLSLIASLQIIRSGDENILNSNIFYFKYDFQYNKYWFLEVIGQHQINKVYFNPQRDLISFGFKQFLHNTSKIQVFSGNSIMIEKVAIRDSINYRLSFYIDSKFKISKTKLGFGLYIQPEIRDFSDKRFLLDFNMEVPINKFISLKNNIIWLNDLNNFKSFNFNQNIKILF